MLSFNYQPADLPGHRESNWLAPSPGVGEAALAPEHWGACRLCVQAPQAWPVTAFRSLPERAAPACA